MNKEEVLTIFIKAPNLDGGIQKNEELNIDGVEPNSIPFSFPETIINHHTSLNP